MPGRWNAWERIANDEGRRMVGRRRCFFRLDSAQPCGLPTCFCAAVWRLRVQWKLRNILLFAVTIDEEETSVQMFFAIF